MSHKLYLFHILEVGTSIQVCIIKLQIEFQKYMNI